MSKDIGGAFARLGGERIDPAIVVPAALPLNLCGEQVRARLCMFTDHTNIDMALRPDLTLPVALAEIARRTAGVSEDPSVYHYCAPAFRQPSVPGEPLEFIQVGFEQFGAEATAEIDAQAYILVSETAEEAGVKKGTAQLGDLAILPAFIDALALSPTVNAGLRRAFREKGGVDAYLARAEGARDGFASELIGLDRPEVEARFKGVMSAQNITHFGNRTDDEIITRLMEQARDVADGAVPSGARQILEEIMLLACAPAEAAGRLRAIAAANGIESVGEAISQLEARMRIILDAAPRFLHTARFSPSFGRRFTYYDGFVFEIAEPGAREARPFGAGGRYDALLSDLSLGTVSTSAIGGVVRPDRLEIAAGEASL